MERRVFDSVKYEKEKAMARFNLSRRLLKLWQFLEALVVLVLISWSTGRVPAVMRVAGGYFVELTTCLLNHHVVFLIGNAIIVSLFMLCRQSDASVGGGGDFYDDYVKYSEAAHPREPAPPPPMTMMVTEDARAPAEETEGDGGKQLAVRAEQETEAIDDVAAAIEEATRQIERFQRTQSEKLKREISARSPPLELRRSETENRRKTNVSEIETLSDEEFNRIVDAFIDKHRSRRTQPLLKMA